MTRNKDTERKYNNMKVEKHVTLVHENYSDILLIYKDKYEQGIKVCSTHTNPEIVNML